MFRRMSAGRADVGGRQSRSTSRLLLWLAEAGVFCLSVLGCSGVEDHPLEPPENQKAPPAMQASTASPEKENPLDDLKKMMMDRQTRLYVAGGAALVIAVVFAVGVGKILRGSPAKPGLVAHPGDGRDAGDVGTRS